jgi:hypothetical protein
MQAANSQNQSSSAAVDDSTPTSERSFSFPPMPLSGSLPRSPNVPAQSRPTHDISQQSSRRSQTPSRNTSPALLSGAGPGLGGDGDWSLGNSRDESAFYQAETQMLTRENQMLRLRIRELGKLMPYL